MSDPNQIKLGKVTRNSSDEEPIPKLQITYLEKVADAALLLPYGLTSRPIPGDTLCLVINIQGQEENRIAIPLGSTKRKKGLKDGETVLENQKAGSFLYMREDGTLEIQIPQDLLTIVKAIAITASGDTNLDTSALKITTPSSEITGTLKSGGGFGCNGKAPQGSYSLGAPATNLATVIALANNIRQALINNGIGA